MPVCALCPARQESGLTHVHVRGDRPALLAASKALAARTGVRLFGNLRGKYNECGGGGGGYAAADAAKRAGTVAVGHGGMAEDEYFTEWKVPTHWLELPAAAVTAAYVEAWTELFALVDADADAAAALSDSAAAATPAAAKL
eukprot:SAG22_NODE_103_length_20175_cov_15.280833_21_plen_142_part_00